KPRVLYAGEARPFWGLAYSANGRYLAIGSPSGVKLLDAATGKEIDVLSRQVGAVGPVALSSPGDRLATGGLEQNVILWDVATKKKIHTLRGASQVMALAYRPDGKQLAAAGVAGEILVWNTATGEKALSFTGHAGMASGVAFSPDGQRLASCGFDF